MSTLLNDLRRSLFARPWPVLPCLVLATVLAITTLAGRLSLLRYHVLDLNGAEENVVYGVIKALGPAPLYTHPEAVPFDVIQYSPAFYAICVATCKLVGVDGSEPIDVYTVTRSLGLLFNLLFIVVAHAYARRAGAAWYWALLWSMVLFLFIPRQAFSRPDALHLLVFASAMFFLLNAGALPSGKKRTRRLDLAVILAALDPMTKQSGVLALLIIGAVLVFLGERRALGRAILLGTAVLGISVLLLCLHYGPAIVHANLITGIRNGISTTPQDWLAYQLAEPSFLLVQIIGLVTGFALLRHVDPVRRALGIGLVLSFFFGHLTGLKYGSSAAYHMENMLLAVVALASLRIPARGWGRWGTEFALFATAFYCLRIMHLKWGIVVLLGNADPDPYRPAYADAARMATEMRTDPALREGLVLLTQHDHLENFLVGRSVITQKDIVLLESSKEHFDLSGFSKVMASGEVRWVISRTPVDMLPLIGPPPRPLLFVGQRHGYFLYRNPPPSGGPAPALR